MNVVIFSDVNGILGFGRYGGAYKVATELRLAGFTVQVVEFFADLSLEQIRVIADKFVGKDTLFVGFATTLMIKKTDEDGISRLDVTRQNRNSGHLPHNNDFVEEMFAIFKRKNPAVKIVIGGGKASVTTLQGVDFWLWGYADRSIIALAQHLAGNGQLTTKPGRTGTVVTGQDYPYRDYSTSKIVWQANDYVFPGEHLPVEIDRGCIFRCTFCANTLFKNFGEFAKDPRSLRDELMYNYDNFGTTGYMFCDDTSNDSQEKVERLHPVLTSLPFELEWTGFARVDVIYGHKLQRELLRESGVRALLFGIETFHPVAGKGVSKGLDPDKVKDTLYYLRETWKGKVTMTGSFIVGLPGEPEDSIWRTVEWLKQPDCPLDNAIFSAMNIRAMNDNPNAPMSKIQADPEKYGYKIVGPAPGTGISTDGPFWTNEFMDKRRAAEMVAEIHKSHLKAPPIADWAIYSRLRSLGFSHEQVVNKRSSDSEFRDDAIVRRNTMRSQYIEHLLQ
jgi:hypothetical protein